MTRRWRPPAPTSPPGRARPTGEGLDAILVNTSGCGTTVKDYGFMFRNEPERAAAERVSALAADVSEFLFTLDYQPTREPPGLTVAYHAACSLQHGQQVTAAAEGPAAQRRVHGRGAGGRPSVLRLGRHLQPDAAGDRRPAAGAQAGQHRRTTGAADLIAAGNIGCLTQLAGGGLPTVHTVELLDWMAGGPKPAAVPA